jgi:hypothetical protein
MGPHSITACRTVIFNENHQVAVDLDIKIHLLQKQGIEGHFVHLVARTVS